MDETGVRRKHIFRLGTLFVIVAAFAAPLAWTAAQVRWAYDRTEFLKGTTCDYGKAGVLSTWDADAPFIKNAEIPWPLQVFGDGEGVNWITIHSAEPHKIRAARSLFPEAVIFWSDVDRQTGWNVVRQLRPKPRAGEKVARIKVAAAEWGGDQALPPVQTVYQGSIGSWFVIGAWFMGSAFQITDMVDDSAVFLKLATPLAEIDSRSFNDSVQSFSLTTKPKKFSTITQDGGMYFQFRLLDIVESP